MKFYDAVEGFVFDVFWKASLPILIWWTNHGLKREDLSQELKDCLKEIYGNQH